MSENENLRETNRQLRQTMGAYRLLIEDFCRGLKLKLHEDMFPHEVEMLECHRRGEKHESLKVFCD